MYEVGEIVRWMEPLDHEYSYGKLIEIKRNRAIIEEMGYYSGRVVSIHLKYVKHLGRSSRGESKKHYK